QTNPLPRADLAGQPPRRLIGSRRVPLDVLTRQPRVCIVCMVKSGDLIRELRAEGWVLNRIRGSHHVFRHASRPGSIVVPHPKKDLGAGMVAATRKQAELTR